MTDETNSVDAEPVAEATGPDAGLEVRLDELLAENAALKEQVLRVAADGENAKRRAEREANDARAYAIQKFARDLLGVADNLSRALQHAPGEDAAESAVKNFVLGVELTEKELGAAFERNGLKKVEPPKGAKFDPNLHQAMMEQPALDVEPGAVIQVMQAGYELMGRIVRPALVIVASKDSAKAAAGAYAAPEGEAGASVDRKA